MVVFVAFFFARAARAVQDTVFIQDFFFDPDSVTVNQGDSVIWINNGAIQHTSTSDDEIWDSGILSNGDSYTLSLDSPGDFPYHCSIHPSMLGNIEVLPLPDVMVDIGDFFFSPAVIQIDIGQTVRWTNTSTITIHTSTAVGGLWNSGDLAPNDFFDFTFNSEGVFDYMCTYHPELMNGTVIVGTPDSVDAEVMIGEYFFNSDDITVPVGSYVRWINFGTIIHTVTDTSANYFDSGDMQPGDTYTLFADSVGDFYYLCNYHPTLMSGALHVLDTTSSGPCDYFVGDVNGSASYNGLDVTYGVSFFKGGPPPVYSCECTPGHVFYVSGDVNGSCSYNGLDITYGVTYFKGGPGPIPCPDCPPPPSALQNTSFKPSQSPRR